MTDNTDNTHPRATVLVTGANRGLGLHFCQQYAAAGWRVLATCRSPQSADALTALATQYQWLSVHALDMTDGAQIDALSAQLSEQAIDLLINNAGVYGDKPEQSLGQLDYAAWMTTLAVNTVSPVKMTEAFLPQLAMGQGKLVVAISSLMGSIADNTSGGSVLYRSSKAGLNAAMKSLAIDLAPRGIGVLILHPGWARTDMGGPNGLIDAETSVTNMRQVIDHFGMEKNGQFLRYDGKALPW